MTNKQKIAILKKMSDQVHKRQKMGDDVCLCFCYRNVTGEWITGEEMARLLGLKRKPKSYKGTTAWFEQWNAKPRLKLIDQQIKRLSK